MRIQGESAHRRCGWLVGWLVGWMDVKYHEDTQMHVRGNEEGI